MGLILWTIIGGIIIGLLGKWVAPGDRDNIPFWLTVVCGILGILIGNYVYKGIWDYNSGGFDWWRHIWQVVVAAILVMIAASVTGRSSRKA
jgi:uncharacterized membrane protein YeaQ/YmgE (transglycosylase-associated protein family)